MTRSPCGSQRRCSINVLAQYGRLSLACSYVGPVQRSAPVHRFWRRGAVETGSECSVGCHAVRRPRCHRCSPWQAVSGALYRRAGAYRRCLGSPIEGCDAPGRGASLSSACIGFSARRGRIVRHRPATGGQPQHAARSCTWRRGRWAKSTRSPSQTRLSARTSPSDQASISRASWIVARMAPVSRPLMWPLLVWLSPRATAHASWERPRLFR